MESGDILKTKKLGKVLRLLAIALILVALPFTAGCSVSSLSNKFLNKTQAEAQLPADFVHIDEKELTKAASEMINAAKKSIYVEQYEFDRKDLINLLVQKSKQGIEVKVLLDKTPKANQATYDYLRANGVSAQYYPIVQGQASKSKLLCVDTTRALVCGNDWTNSDLLSHDVGIELKGKAAWRASSIFARDWKFTTTIDLNLPDNAEPEDNIVLATNANIQSFLTRQVQDSKTSIQIEVTYLTYPPELITQLTDFATSGKKVQVIIDSSQYTASKTSVDKLQASGVQIRLYPTDAAHKLNGRFALFDNHSVFLSSANWSRSSFTQNHELGLFVPSTSVAQKFAVLFKADWEKSKPPSAK